ncbi:hypothetical protein [Streptomyces sp. NPDC007355]|uniref:hypothetical protein n=1 Tax=Streptomyces sp. NPDC007355 TaxID=3364778 RepID=UPI003682ED24
MMKRSYRAVSCYGQGLAAVALTAGLLVTAAPSAGAEDVGVKAGLAAAHRQPAVRTLTLLTGDRIRVTTGEDGKERVDVLPGPGRSGVSFAYESQGKHLSVVPSDVLSLVLSGAIDAELFDVTALMAKGIGMSSTSGIPLSVTYSGGSAGSRAREGLAFASGTAAGRDIRVAESVPRAAAVWAVLTDPSDQGVRLAPGVSKVEVAGGSAPFSVSGAEAMHTLTFHIFDRKGQPLPPASVSLIDTVTGERYPLEKRVTEAVAEVPTGHYSVDALIYTYEHSLQSITLAALPDIDVTADQSLSLDARAGMPTRSRVEGVDAPDSVVRWMGINQQAAGQLVEHRANTQKSEVKLFAVPTAPVTSRPFGMVQTNVLTGEGPNAPVYNIALEKRGGIPQELDLAVSQEQLAHVSSRYHRMTDTSAPGHRSDLASFDHSDRASGSFHEVAFPSQRDEYFTTDPDISWRSSVGSDSLFETAATTNYQPGGRYTEDWSYGVLAPAADSAARCEGYLYAPTSPLVSPVAGRVAGVNGFTTSMQLHENGKLISETEDANSPLFGGLSDQPSRYSMVLKAENTNPNSLLPQKVEAEWLFNSSKADDDCAGTASLPLLSVRTDIQTDLNNSKPAGQPVTAKLLPEWADHTNRRLTSLTLQATHDNGATWHNIPATRTASGYEATIPAAPSGSTKTGLRTYAEDENGTILRQTVLGAYRQG